LISKIRGWKAVSKGDVARKYKESAPTFFGIVG